MRLVGVRPARSGGSPSPFQFSLGPSPLFQRPSHFIGFDIVYSLEGRGAAQTTRLTLPALRVSLPPRS
jgi:hypothetical protein